MPVPMADQRKGRDRQAALNDPLPPPRSARMPIGSAFNHLAVIPARRTQPSYARSLHQEGCGYSPGNGPCSLE